MTDKVKVQISREAYNLLKKAVEESNGEFKDVEDLLEFIINETLGEEGGEGYSPEEEAEIKDRLRSLGYL